MEGFFRRSFRTIALVGLLAGLMLWAYLGWDAAVAGSLGVLIGALMLAGTVIAVEGVVQPPELRRPRRWLYGVLHAGKFVLAAGLIYAVFRWLPGRLPLVALGYLLPTVIIVLRAAGRGVNRKMDIE